MTDVDVVVGAHTAVQAGLINGDVHIHSSDTSIEPHHVEAVHSDSFLLDQLDLAPARVLDALARQAQRFRNPAMDLSGLLARLERCDVPEFAEEVRRIAL